MALSTVRRLYELGIVGLCLVVAVRSWRTRGAGVTVRELAFGFLLSQSVEWLAVQCGRYSYPDWVVYFPPHPAFVPLGVGLGWAALMPVVMRVSDRILGGDEKPWKLGALDGLMGVGLDLVIDPAVSGDPLNMWQWRGAGMTPYRLWLLNVPVFNFVGWFLLVGACSWQLRRVERSAPSKRNLQLASFLAIDLVVATVVMRLPWW
ncbi:MAG: carotenoid biosynthesis protein [Polyangiales bacterium]